MKDPVQDKLIWQKYLETVVKPREDWKDIIVHAATCCNQTTHTQMIHILGIRHHGPGSARNVKEFLEAVKPDIVLVEGLPGSRSLAAMGKPCRPETTGAILVYQPDNPQRSSFIPCRIFTRMAGDNLCPPQQHPCAVYGPAHQPSDCPGKRKKEPLARPLSLR